jgi:hypothetical protein
MGTWRAIFLTNLIVVCGIAARAQDTDLPAQSDPAATPLLKHRPAVNPPIEPSDVAPAGVAAIPHGDAIVPLTVPRGTGVQVVLGQEMRIKNIGQPIHGRVAEPIYAFDKLVVPAGTEVSGHIKQLTNVSRGRRVLDVLDANFTPSRKVEMEFDELVFSDGRHIPIHTSVGEGSGQVIKFITSPDADKKKTAKKLRARKPNKQSNKRRTSGRKQWSKCTSPGKCTRLNDTRSRSSPFIHSM